MKPFGETIRNLRVAQNLGLRETALKLGISPAYLSRIERGKESPPRPDVIKGMAKFLAADPDVLFRLSSSTDPEFIVYLNNRPDAMHLLRFLKDSNFTSSQLKLVYQYAEQLKTSSR